MLRRVASQVSLRSRERKLRLFLDLLAPGPETTVVDVGVTDAPFGGGSSDNFFEAMYPWPERITAVGHTELDRFTAAFPARCRPCAPTAASCRSPTARSTSGSRTRSSSTSPAAATASGGSCTSSAASRGASSSRRRTGGSRSRCTRCCRSFTGCPRGARERVIPFDDVLDPLGPKAFASLFPYEVRVLNRGMTLVAVGPA